MSEAISIPLDKIHVPENYVRPLDVGEAYKLARQMKDDGQKTPIAVYESPARGGGRTPFTLIYGARRLWAARELGWTSIEAVLRPKDETNMVALLDNLETSALDELEQAEHLTEYRKRWEAANGKIGRGGDRKSKRQDVALINVLGLSGKSLFYNDLEMKTGIGERKAQRLFKIGNLDPDLRNALRGSPVAKDQSKLKMLATKYPDAEAQKRIAADFLVTGDLAATLRKGDPDTGREPVGRLETAEWQESHLIEHLDRMPEALREAALERYGFIRKPLDPWPADLPEVRAIPAPGNDSPLWDMLRDPYARLSPKMTYEQVMKLKAQYEEEARELERYRKGVQANIEEQEKARQETFAAEREQTEAKKARAMLKRTGTYKDLPAREKEMLAELDSSLQQALGDSMGRRHADLVRACHALDGTRQVAMADVLYRGCDKGLAKEYAALLLADQRSKPRGAGRREVTMPLLVARKGPEKGILPHLWKRVKAMRGVLGMQTGFLKALTPERQSFVCDLLNRNIPEDHILLYARKLSSGEGNRRKFRDAVITGDIAPEEIPEWLNQIDFEPPSKPVERDLERT